jgi:glucose/arabinose dehydrogenase
MRTHRRICITIAAVVGASLIAFLPLDPPAASGESAGRGGEGGGIFELGTITTEQGTQLRLDRVAQNLSTVWDMKWAPDGELWFTQRGGRVSRLNVETGQVVGIGTVPNVVQRSESGLMGFAFHPDFPREPWIYFAHSYSPTGSSARRRRAQPVEIRNRLIRMRYEDGKLDSAETLIDNIAGATNHDGAALTVGPDRFLYMSMGDAGQGELAQDSVSLNGKILRLTLDGKAAPGNPFSNAIFSRGHRNPQGLVFHPTTGALFSTEHGDSIEDEVNRIERGRNYGWPTVEGRCDGDMENEFCRTAIVVQPVWVASPTVGISGIDIYESEAIPGWKGSLLVTALGGRSLYRLTLSSDKRTVTGAERLYEDDFGRLRDVLTGPDGSVYVATSNRDGRGKPRNVDDRIIRIRR